MIYLFTYLLTYLLYVPECSRSAIRADIHAKDGKKFSFCALKYAFGFDLKFIAYSLVVLTATFRYCRLCGAIIYRATRQMSYDSLLYCSDVVTSLEDRRSQQEKSFFTSILDQYSCLHHLLPYQRDNVVTSKLRSALNSQYHSPGQINFNRL